MYFHPELQRLIYAQDTEHGCAIVLISPVGSSGSSFPEDQFGTIEVIFQGRTSGRQKVSDILFAHNYDGVDEVVDELVNQIVIDRTDEANMDGYK